MTLLQLEGNVDRNDRDTIIESQGAEIERLQAELRRTKAELVTVRAQSENAVNAITALRNVLSQLYNAMRGIFGEIELVVPGNAQAPSHSAPAAAGNAGYWEAWKKRLGGKQAEFIDALLEHGEMTGAQLKIATRSGQQTVYDVIAKLNKAQLLNKNGGRYSLKEHP